MSKLIIDDQSFEVSEEVSIEFNKMQSKLKKVQNWIDKTDSVVNGCGIEDEYDELFNIMHDDDKI
jgi:hypothetical protein